MHLREYIALLLRYWPVLVLLPLLTAGLSTLTLLGRTPVFQTTVRLMVTQAPEPDPELPLPPLDVGTTWLTTAYILDDLPAVISSALFATDVQAAMAAQGYALEVPAIQGGLRVETTHRSVLLSATAATPELAVAMAQAAVTSLREGGLVYWGRDPAGGLQVQVIDPPGAAASSQSLTGLVREVGLRVALALVAAVGIALGLAYLDDRIYHARQAERWTGAPVLAVIPEE
ncbi:hypothetical protein EYB53_002395 [Candidatus Chloroploca sp. M-50]|uniref:Lipopolysaccharide biosynthesis protein n=1 Tax=Candidatus Chloroploca mongolica TaxID=2528176 RepID=A0ABS4D537_9CHLR|nr:hypothetical protein [Candidatus Chloroploca mongolica]MBP1464550.1 hypothetical protein [Candidatus Chloroploca mongolica]